jgi:hypothetical protein
MYFCMLTGSCHHYNHGNLVTVLRATSLIQKQTTRDTNIREQNEYSRAQKFEVKCHFQRILLLIIRYIPYSILTMDTAYPGGWLVG